METFDKTFDEKYFSERRTIRSYTSEPVSDDLLNRLLDAAMHAPTTGNMQLYSVVVTRTDEGKKRLAPLHFNQPCVEQAAVVLTFCADCHRFTRWCEASGVDAGFNNFQSFFAAVLDTALFAQQFNTLAELNGLGCCYLGTTSYNAPQIAETLSLPAMVVPVVTLTVGYPASAGVDSGRLPLAAVMHTEKYADYTDEAVRELYAEKEVRDDSRRFVTENNCRNLADVFVSVRYPRPSNEEFSKIYSEFIKGAGF